MLRDSRERRECSQSQVKLLLTAAEASVDSEFAQVWHKAQRALKSTLRKRSSMSRATQSHGQLAFKSPWFLVSVAWNARCWITQPEGSGLQMFKVTSLDSRKTWIPRCRRPLTLERTKTTWNDLVTLLRATQQPRRDTRKRKKAVDWKWLKLDGWFCSTCIQI